MSSFAAKAMELAHKSMHTKCKNAKLIECNASVQGELVELFPAGRRMRKKLEAAGAHVKHLKTQLADAKVALEKLEIEVGQSTEGLCA